MDGATYARSILAGHFCNGPTEATPMINAPQKGDRIGQYRVDEMVARGGMASIFRGTDVCTGDPVAIKVPHPELECDVLFFDRFHREADIGRKLDHRGVVRVLPCEDAGRVCMIMEWAEGIPLRELLDSDGKLPPDRALRITIQICEALDYIHKHGVVHRDLKPEQHTDRCERRHQTPRFRYRQRGGSTAPDVRQAHEIHGNAGLRLTRTGERKARRSTK